MKRSANVLIYRFGDPI